MPGRPKNRNQTTKVHPTISVQTLAFIQELVRIGSYGNTDSEAAAYLIQRSIDDLLRAGVLKPSTGTKGE